jgi:23S rRNA (uracil1939-C5)-methyltransferase
MEYAIQKKYKEDQVKEALIHLGGIADPPIEPIIDAKKVYYYRNKMEFSFQVGREGELLLGLHVAGRFRDVFQLTDCHLQSESSNGIVNFVRQRCNELKLPAYDIVKHEGYMRFLVVRDGKFTNEILVNLVTGAGDYPQIETLANEIGQKFDHVVSVSHTVNSKKANIAKGDKEKIIFGSDHIHEHLGNRNYRISSNSFFQTNSYQVQRLYDLAVELAQPEKLDNMIDLYTGTGTIAIYFAGLVKNVLGVETVAEAVADAKINANLNGVKNCEFIVADVEEYLGEFSELAENVDLLMIDPPRSGCHPKALKSILKLKPKKIVYISCNPATLARDIQVLTSEFYSLDRAVPVDLFPQTYHIEAACRLTLKEI